jgi:hypothetical protein
LSASPPRSAPEAAFSDLAAAYGVRAALGGLLWGAAGLLGLAGSSRAALARRTGCGLLAEAAVLPPAAAPLSAAVARDPALPGDLYAGALAGGERKRRGAFYTPSWAVDVVLDTLPALAEHPGGILDPACGGGRFLVGALERLRAHLPVATAMTRLQGVDADPVAVALTRAALFLSSGEPAEDAVAAGDLLSSHEAPEGLGVVLGNPPYRGGRFSPLASMSPAALARFRVAEYQVDPYVLFIEAGLAALRPGGQLALVVPNAFMSNLRTAALRRLLGGEHRLEAVVELPPETFAAGVETVLLRVTRGGRARSRVPVLAAGPEAPVRPAGELVIDLDAPAAPWPLFRPGTPLVPALSRAAGRLGDVAEVTRGINPYHHTRHTPDEIARRVHHAHHCAGHEYTPELRGRDLQPFRIDWGGRHWIRWGPWLKEPRHPRFFEGPRLLVRKILGETLVAAYTDAPFHCDQSVYIVKLRPGQPWPPLALLAWVGSRPLADLLRARHQEHDRLFPQLKVTELRNAPLPPVAPDAPAVRALAEHMAVFLADGAPESGRAAIDAEVRALYESGPSP